MSDLLNPNPAPQFSIAEFGSTPSGDACKMCQKPITATYYRANGAMVCDSCADKVRRNTPQDSHAAFVKAMLFGLGGFLAGLIAYAGLAILFEGFRIGYMALGVGWIVGKAMMMGSGNIGGRRYQIAAVLLTYAAVSMAAIPISIAYQAKHEQRQTTKQARSQDSANSGSANPSQEAQTDGAPQKAGAEAPTRSPIATLFIGLAQLALIGLASPFLELADGAGGLIGFVILFVGMRFAWKMTAGRANVPVEGPYRVSTPAAAGASA